MLVSILKPSRPIRALHQDICYYSAPEKKPTLNSLDEADPELLKYFDSFNTAVFSNGSFCYIPKDTRCPMPISTYFRINALETGQFERALIVADEGSSVEYLEGCTATSYDRNQLNAAVVEFYCAEGAEIKYCTVQNWYAVMRKEMVGFIILLLSVDFVLEIDQRYLGPRWRQVCYNLEVPTNNYQQADTGTKTIHKGKNSRSRIISKGFRFNQRQRMLKIPRNNAAANTYPYIQDVEHWWSWVWRLSYNEERQLVRCWTVVVVGELLKRGGGSWLLELLECATWRGCWNEEMSSSHYDLLPGNANPSSDELKQNVEQILLIMNFFFPLQMSSSHYELLPGNADPSSDGFEQKVEQALLIMNFFFLFR
ncbi:UPF0051 protein ABCI8 [Hibiscus syriacus]|uniref:UPF0051 protein ABCI8 n=1 Tax=Hibiscus syriacus TaxID=106335 RepID=A0A6A2WJW1_HIBSY|nr:UPF0051 protein ABCI8 [Hibiscus syriacus]